MGVLGFFRLPAVSIGSLLGVATQVLFGLGWVALGYHLWRDSSNTASVG